MELNFEEIDRVFNSFERYVTPAEAGPTISGVKKVVNRSYSKSSIDTKSSIRERRRRGIIKKTPKEIAREEKRREILKTQEAKKKEKLKRKTERKEEKKKEKLIKEIERNVQKETDKWFEIEEYEDPKENFESKPGWIAFKTTLAAIALAGSLFIAHKTANEVIQFLDTIQPSYQVEYYENMAPEEQDIAKNNMREFKNKVQERDGYVFDYISDEELADAYLRMTACEKKMYNAQFENVLFKDQELLNRIVRNSLGDEKYDNLTEGQREDYVQLAYETVFDVKGADVTVGIRNPIVMKHIKARDAAEQKGYRNMEIKVNNDQKENVKIIGALIHNTRMLTPTDFYTGDYQEDGQDFLQNIIQSVIGEKYSAMHKKSKRDFLQLTYELLPDSLKEIVKDPIEVEREQATKEER